MISSHDANRRRSTRRKCPVKTVGPHYVIINSDGSDDEVLQDLKVELKKYPLRIIPDYGTSSVISAKNKENVCPKDDAKGRHKNNVNMRKDNTSSESSDDEPLGKKYPKRNRVPVYKSLPVSMSKKDKSSNDGVLPKKGGKKRPVGKSVGPDSYNKASTTNVSVDKSCRLAFNGSDDSSDDELLLHVANKLKRLNDASVSQRIGYTVEGKMAYTDILDITNSVESDRSSDDDISAEKATDHLENRADRKSYPRRKRMGSQSTYIDNDSNNNSSYTAALHKKTKSANDKRSTVNEDCTEASNSNSLELESHSGLQKSEEIVGNDLEGSCDDVQMESEVDQEELEMLPDVFNNVHDISTEIDTEIENSKMLKGIGRADGVGLKDDDDMEQENVVRARILMSDSLDGQSIYGFVTPKRKDALAKIAHDIRESAKKPKKSSSFIKSAAAGPKSSSKKAGKGSSSNDEDDHTKRSFRQPKNKVTLLHTLAANDSEEDDEGEESSGMDEIDSDEESSEKSSAYQKKDNRDLLDEYFEVHGKFKSLTSDKTLAKLKNPKMEQKELLKHLQDIETSHVKEIVKLYSMHRCNYKNWMLQLLSGFNVLVYGFGSKHLLLEKFRKTMLYDQVHLVVNGFFPSIQLKHVLKTITEEILEKETSFKNNIEHYKYIAKEYDSDTSGKLFIIIHNIEGSMLRSENVQTALAHLASSRNIHVIASIDHISAPLIWDQNRASAFSWLWYDTTTFEAYKEETSFENSLMVQQSGTLALSSLKHVLHSLTSNSKGIFRVLAGYHLDNEDNSSYQGISFGDLYQRCRERFLVNSDLTLRGQLTEFKDHKLIKSKKGYDGVDYLSIALDCSTLRTYLEEEDS